jgi:imidazole glycerol-phosphate synthase subunit HisH
MSEVKRPPEIAIIDYGMGNLRSVQKGFEKVGYQASIISDPSEVESAKKIVLPGVGAFEDAIGELRQKKLVTPVLDAINSGKPFLGICLGMQMLFETNYENGRHQGFGVLKGDCVLFELPKDYAIPHMGWNQLKIRRKAPILQGLPEEPYVYFVHSYYVVPQEAEVVATETDYGGPFCSMIWRDNIFATQFHPEKSQANGLIILKNFAEL